MQNTTSQGFKTCEYEPLSVKTEIMLEKTFLLLLKNHDYDKIWKLTPHLTWLDISFRYQKVS